MRTCLVILSICIIYCNGGLVKRLVLGQSDTDIPRANNKINNIATERVTMKGINTYNAMHSNGKTRIVNYSQGPDESLFSQSSFDGDLCPTGTSRADDGTCVDEE